MSSDDDVEFRDLLSQTLEMNGCLSKIRAQLRASIFLTLDEDEKIQQKEPLANKKVKASLESEEGRLTFCLVREFLEFFNLDFTLSVFNVETYADRCYSYKGRNDLTEKLTTLTDDPNQPLLLQLVNLIKLTSRKSEMLNINHQTETADNSQPNSSSLSLTGLSPICGPNLVFNKTYNVNSPDISESIKTEEKVKSSEVSSHVSGTRTDKLIDKKSNLTESHIDKCNSASSEILKDEKFDGKNRMKCSNILPDLSPLQPNKAKNTDSSLLPSLYNVGKDKTSNLRETDKLLSVDEHSDHSVSEYEISTASSIDSSTSHLKGQSENDLHVDRNDRENEKSLDTPESSSTESEQS